MADLPNRTQAESRFARALAREMAIQRDKVIAKLGKSPMPDKLTPDLFDDMRAALLQVIQPLLEQVFVAQAQSLTTEPPQTARKQGGIGIDFNVINQRAAEWARRYGFDLVTGITDTTQRALGEQVAAYIESGATLEDLQANIARLFGPIRAAQIAVTEITRAASEGEQAFGRELEALGLTVTYVWETSDDERVCPICDPRDGKRRGDGWTDFPPAHVNCRCWINTVVIRG